MTIPRTNIASSPVTAADLGTGDGEPREIELKFRIDDDRAFDGLVAVREFDGGYVLGEPEPHALVDHYVDTDDFALLRSGYLLRLRESPRGTVVTLKGLERRYLGPIHQRFELQGELEGDDPTTPAAWPAPIREHVTGVAGDLMNVRVLCRIDHQRHLSHVRREGNVVGDFCVERVTIGETPRADGSVPVGAFREVEFEMTGSGVLADVEELARQLAERQGLTPSVESKFSHAMRIIAMQVDGRPGITGVQPDMSMAEAARLVCRRQLVEMLLNEAGVRAGSDPIYVHDMRVATRRIRAALRLCGDYFEPRALRAFGKRLRRTARLLGSVRDIDVSTERLEAYRADADGGEAERLDELLRLWRTHQQIAHARLTEWLIGRRFSRFVIDFDWFCRMPRSGALPAGQPVGGFASHEVRHVLPLRVVERFTAVREYERSLKMPRVERELHRLRIDLKRVRYAFEAISHLTGKRGRRVVSDLKKLQDHLGTLNDAAVARDSVRLAVAAGVDPRSVAGYLAHQERVVREQVESFEPAWEAFLEADARGRLMRAIGSL